jgi:hypothetical protein
VIQPGKTVYSDYVNIPNSYKISQVYCGIHKVKYSDGTEATVDAVDYSVWTIK